MAVGKNNMGKGGGSEIRESYPKVLIDRGVAAESSRRNIEIIVWYKRLINVTLGLLVATFFFTVISVLFAFFQPLPELYSTALDGGLRSVKFVRTLQDPSLVSLRSGLFSEQLSRQELAAKTSIKQVAPPLIPALSSPETAPTAK